MNTRGFRSHRSFAIKLGWLTCIALLACPTPISLSAQNAPVMSQATLEDLRGLAPVSALSNTPEGRASLAANLRVTGGIQTGKIHQPTLLPFAQQEADCAE